MRIVISKFYNFTLKIVSYINSTIKGIKQYAIGIWSIQMEVIFYDYNLNRNFYFYAPDNITLSEPGSN